MEDLASLAAAIQEAPQFIEMFEERRSLLDAQNALYFKESTTDAEKELLYEWINNLTDWCVANINTYHRYKAIIGLIQQNAGIEKILETLNAITPDTDRKLGATTKVQS